MTISDCSALKQPQYMVAHRGVSQDFVGSVRSSVTEMSRHFNVQSNAASDMLTMRWCQ